MDFWATKVTLDLAKGEKRPALLVLNRLPPKGKLADTMRAKMGELEAPLAQTSIGNRVALAASLLEGKGIAESSAKSAAAVEIGALADEVFTRAASPGR
jgi:chromosome partitioning protein